MNGFKSSVGPLHILLQRCPAIVSTKVGCAADLVRNGITGYMFAVDNIFELEDAIVKIMNTDLENAKKNCVSLISQWSFDKKCKAIEQTI